ncbi:MAG: DUF1326 domain-containing protein [Steroidobacteraceae bacterium]
MSRVDWRIQGYDVTNCNCAWGCPCQFMSPPTQGHCQAGVFFQVDRGHFGATSLDGLAFGGLFAWPQAIHLGDGQAQPIIDVRANGAQREALLKIMSGEETEPGATIFNVFASTYSKVHAPLFKPIRIEADLGARTARIEVEGLFEARVEPIRNPVTGEEVRAQIVLPAGFEYERADAASGQVRTRPGTSIPLGWESRHAHFARLDMTGAGVVRSHAA